MLQKNQLALLVMGALCLSVSLSAQKILPQNKLSPWTIGLEVAGPINTGADRDVQDFDDALTYGRVGANGSYRIARWLAIEGQLQFHRRASSKQQSFFDNTITGERPLYHLHQKTNMFSFSIGPIFMYRVGQGDLSLALHYGGVLDFSTMRAVRFDQQSANITYQPEMLAIQQAELGYTYWPNTQLGVSAKVSLQNMGTGSSGIGRTLNPSTINSSLTDFEILELESLSPLLNRYNIELIFGIGFHYRFKK